MKTIFNETDKNEILARIEKLTPETKALWGKMNVAQMLAHSVKAIKMASGELATKSNAMQIIGRLIKKSVIYSDQPFRKNSPTAAELVTVVEANEFEKEKTSLITALKNLTSDTAKAEKHPFFGKMTAEEWGIINYKHADHHLRQFGV